MSTLKRLCEAVEGIFKLLQELARYLVSEKKNQADTPEKLLGMEEVMARLNISRSTYFRYVREGELRPRKTGKRHYFYESDLEEALRNSKRKGRL